MECWSASANQSGFVRLLQVTHIDAGLFHRQHYPSRGTLSRLTPSIRPRSRVYRKRQRSTFVSQSEQSIPPASVIREPDLLVLCSLIPDVCLCACADRWVHFDVRVRAREREPAASSTPAAHNSSLLRRRR